MSGEIQVTAKKGDNEATINYNFCENLDDAAELFGKEVVHTGFRANGKIVLQAAMRRRLEAGQSCDDLTTSWKPGVQMERIVDVVAAAKAKYATMSDEDKAAFLADLQAA